ncbi:MAG: CvpA family protein [candidate division Zixibacteria bacterium]|jgi:uncharacterized membrane protein required for colicin V production|nr:CvpA family protein [candidate division Zixibacteria bacterium]
MNWIDGVLVALLLAMVVVGSKKGLIRELMAFVLFFVALIISIRYIDRLAIWMHEQMGGSTLVSAFLSFVILLAGSYVIFKLLGMLFYKFASVKTDKRRDQMGGALVGFLRGWVGVSFLTLLTFLLPLPDWFYTSFENSFFGPTIAKTIPLMYDSTEKLHKGSGNFMEQMESTLLQPNATAPSGKNNQNVDEDRQQVYRVIYQIDRFFNTESPS